MRGGPRPENTLHQYGVQIGSHPSQAQKPKKTNTANILINSHDLYTNLQIKSILFFHTIQAVLQMSAGGP